MKQKRKLKIAQVAPIWGKIPPEKYGGAERIINILTEELHQQGHDVTLFATADSKSAAEIESVIPNGVVDSMINGTAYAYEQYLNAHIENVIQKSGSYDLIHFHLNCSDIPLSILSKTKILHTIHTYITIDDEWVLNKFSQVPVVGITNQQISPLKRSGRGNTYMIYNSCDFSLYEVGKKPGKYLAFLGRIGAHKGLHNAISISKQLKIPLRIGGMPVTPEDKMYFEARIKPHINGKDIVHLGEVNDSEKNELFSQAIALLFCIEWDEPFGLVMIEAMACGVPVLGIKRGAVTEVVDYGITGYYATSIAALINKHEKVSTLDRNQIRDHAKKRFGYKNMVKEYISLYQNIYSSNS